MVKDPEVCDPIRFLRKREIVHFQRFGEVLRDAQEHLDSRNFYAFNPSFDMPQGPACKEKGTEKRPAAAVPGPVPNQTGSCGCGRRMM